VLSVTLTNTTLTGSEARSDGPPPRVAVEARGLSKTYPTGTVALRDLTLSVAEGEVFGLLGPNGAGKSTSIGILTTLVTPTAGAASVGGIDVRHDPLAVRRRIGVVFQDSVLDNEFTVAENLRLHARLWGLSADDGAHRTRSLLDQLGLADRTDDGVRTLSGGLRRRVEIARGLLAHPRVLFLDEPTVGLDPTVRAEIWRLIAELRNREGVTVVLTTHYLEEAESVCDRVGILHEGRLVALDRPRSLIDTLGGFVVELRTAGDPRGLVEALDREHLGSRPPLVSAGLVSVTSRRPREELATTVARLQAAHPSLDAATVRATTLSDVYHQLTGAPFTDDQKPAR
jgi:ABC-2 type transport system ATP-binding protein